MRWLLVLTLASCARHAAQPYAVDVDAPPSTWKTPPCRRDIEVERLGHCWMRHVEPPPCPRGTTEDEGICLVPMAAE